MSTFTKTRRKKVNFMIEQSLMDELENLIPAGERSDFMNEVLESGIVKFTRQKAHEMVEKLREDDRKNKVKHSTKEILKTIHEGRKKLL